MERFPAVMIQELHAYLADLKTSVVMDWISAVIPLSLQQGKPQDWGIAGLMLTTVKGSDEVLILEKHDSGNWLELTIQVKTANSIFANWDNLQLGEQLVDDLGCIALVDCGGRYTSPHSDRMIRISSDKIELVVLPASLDQPVDETWTQLIQDR